MQKILIQQYHNATIQLSISRDEYIFSLRPSYTYSFIEFNNKYYFPLPHLLPRNITSSLFYRLTEGNDTLRSALGKNVIEQYVYEIVSQSNCYADVLREVTYNGPKGTQAQSPDLIARHENSILLLECKSTVPSIGMRTLSDKAYRKTQTRLAEHIVQLYKGIQHFGQYNPFENLQISKDNIWGCVILLEDPYIRRENIYSQVLNLLNIPSSSDEAAWIMQHIKIIDLYQLETLCFSSNSIIDAIKETNATGEVTAIPLKVPGSLKLTNKNFLQFRSSTVLNIHNSITG